MKKIIASTGIAVAAAMGVGTGTAHAAPTVNVTFPGYRIASIHTVKICGHVTNPGSMGHFDIAAWGIAKSAADFNNNGPSYIGDYAYSPEFGNSCALYDPFLYPLGEYHGYPDSSENLKQGDSWGQNTPTFWIKYNSTATVKVARSGNRVTVSGYAKHYHINQFDVGSSQPWAGHSIAIQQFRTGGVYGKGRWVTVKTLAADSNGWTRTYTFTYGLKRPFRAVTAGTSTIWGATSATVTR